MPVRIIIADDEPLQRMDLKDVLTRRGYEVIGEAADGLSVLKLARLQRPDLIIMDIRMPDMDGINAAEALVREKIAPVILLTAYTDRIFVQRAREIGVINYLIKPLHESEVVPAIEMALSHARQMAVMEERIRLLSEQLDAQRVAERAKGLLQEKQGLSQQEAFRKIQKMPQGKPAFIRGDVEAVLDELHKLLRGRLTLGASTFINALLLSHMVDRYKALYPNIELTLSISDTQVGLEKLEAQEIELLFLEESVALPTLFEHIWRYNDTCTYVVYLLNVQVSKAAQAFLDLFAE